MEKNAFLLLLDDLLELDPGTLMGDELLETFESWDSLTAVGFIALVDEQFDVAVSPRALASCRTVNDLAELAIA